MTQIKLYLGVKALISYLIDDYEPKRKGLA